METESGSHSPPLKNELLGTKKLMKRGRPKKLINAPNQDANFSLDKSSVQKKKKFKNEDHNNLIKMQLEENKSST